MNNGKGCWNKNHPCLHLEGLRKTTKIFCQDRDSQPGFKLCKSNTLLLRLHILVEGQIHIKHFHNLDEMSAQTKRDCWLASVIFQYSGKQSWLWMWKATTLFGYIYTNNLCSLLLSTIYEWWSYNRQSSSHLVRCWFKVHIPALTGQRAFHTDKKRTRNERQ
jgi:hypothetical protein